MTTTPNFSDSFRAPEKAAQNLIKAFAPTMAHRTASSDGVQQTSPGETFGAYLEALIAEDEGADGEIAPAATREQFLAIIQPYGFTIDSVIPSGFYEILRKSL